MVDLITVTSFNDGTMDKSCQISSKDIDVIGPRANDARNIVSGNYKGKNVLLDPVIADLDISVFKIKPIDYQLVDKSARLLNENLRERGLSVPHCLSWVQDPLQQEAVFVFHLPFVVFPDDHLITLQHLFELDRANLDLEMPNLSQRFQIAKSLACTLFELHTIGWLHGRFNAHNVLFWQMEDESATFVFEEPDVVGFGAAAYRPQAFRTDVDYLSSWSSSRTYGQLGLTSEHHPPDFVDDLISLGLILLEIGLCRTIISLLNFKETSSHSINHVREVALSHAHAVGATMGIRYLNAMVACLSVDKELLGVRDLGDGREKCLRWFGHKVVDVIAACQA